MPATSVTGKGKGAANKPTFDEMSTSTNGPVIIFTGIVESTEGVSSPPTEGSNTVNFPYPLEGGEDKYVVILTTINAGYVYVSDRDEDDDGKFTGFTFITETEGSVMYLVARVGQKPNF